MKRIITATIVLAATGQTAQAENFEDQYQYLPIECGQAFETGPAEGSRCLKYRFDETVMDYTAELVNDHGKAVFGDNFGFVHRMSWSPFSAGTSRTLDAVIPLYFDSSDVAPDTGKTALFLQSGVTRWQDTAGFTRNDIRQGFAYRFALSDDRKNILGMSALYQENIERRHKRLVMTLDYAGRYGTGRLQHYVPASGWQPGRSGYEERAIGGTEIGVNVGITSTLSLDAALTRWNDESEVDGRISLGLRPHPWLRFRAGYATGFSGDTANVHVRLTIPLEGASKRVPRWEGLGAPGVAGTPSDIWRPVANVEQLQTVERRISPASETRPGGSAVRTDDVTVRFLQSEAVSSIGVHVSIPAPLSEDLRLALRLAPGNGNNPAVPGQDFVDEPQEVTIAQGEVSTTAYFQLLHNDDQQANRSLAVMVSLDASS